MNEQRTVRPRSRRGRFAPVTTYYTGTRFERRLEARWAAFFDAAGIPHRYYNTIESPETGSASS